MNNLVFQHLFLLLEPVQTVSSCFSFWTSFPRKECELEVTISFLFLTFVSDTTPQILKQIDPQLIWLQLNFEVQNPGFPAAEVVECE